LTTQKATCARGKVEKLQVLIHDQCHDSVDMTLIWQDIHYRR